MQSGETLDNFITHIETTYGSGQNHNFLHCFMSIIFLYFKVRLPEFYASSHQISMETLAAPNFRIISTFDCKKSKNIYRYKQLAIFRNPSQTFCCSTVRESPQPFIIARASFANSSSDVSP